MTLSQTDICAAINEKRAQMWVENHICLLFMLFHIKICKGVCLVFLILHTFIIDIIDKLSFPKSKGFKFKCNTFLTILHI